MNWTGQRDRFECTNGEIFHEAETHNPSLSFKMSWKLGPRFQMRIEMGIREEKRRITVSPVWC
jgi:hypothetical protein